MNMPAGGFRRLMVCLLMSVMLACVVGCEDDDDYDYDPPDGLGAILIDNRTFNDIYVYIDGQEQVRSPYRGERAYDQTPGVVRVLLDERGGDRFWSEDVDVLEGRTTVIRVQDDFDNDYDVDILLD